VADKRLLEQQLGEPVLGIVETHSDLLEDHLPLALDLACLKQGESAVSETTLIMVSTKREATVAVRTVLS